MKKILLMYSALNEGTKKIAEEIKNKSEQKGAEVIFYDLNEPKEMLLCMGCKYCDKINGTEFGCPLKDFVYEVYDYALEADEIVSVTSIEDTCMFGTQRYKDVINRLQVATHKSLPSGEVISVWEGKGYFTVGTYEDSQANVPAFQMITEKYGPYYKARKSEVVVCKEGDLTAADKIVNAIFE